MRMPRVGAVTATLGAWKVRKSSTKADHPSGKYDLNLKTYQVRSDEHKEDETNPWPPLETVIQDQLGLKVCQRMGRFDSW